MKILFVSLGCDKNLVDSEVMLGLLRADGFELTDDETEADVIVVNTCGFIRDAKEESINTLLEMARYKTEGKCKALIAAGCLAQRYADEMKEELPEVDAIVGTTAYDKIGEVIRGVLEGQKVTCLKDINELVLTEAKRVNTTGGYTSYLKIAEGCDKHCTYCIIPKMRGSYRSVPMDRLVAEAEELAAAGVKELILVAQETTLYGIDLYGMKKLPELLRRLCRIEGLEWIRILYCYPEEITDELIEVIKTEEKICHYLDMPIQHASDGILKRMGRKTNRAQLEETIAKLRKEIPDIALRTTLITGFPGETKEDQKELYLFVNEMNFDRLGVFTYSAEENTPAAEMADQIPENLKEERRDEIMELQQEIAFEKAEEMPGRTLKVLIEGKIPEDEVYLGRTYRDAPNVDGYIFVSSPYELISGDFVEVKVIEAKDYDLIGIVQ
ncbi:30S ribosomal protein S12 methylthiotransferase RimO [Anaerolentibacter hominis]|uniref:30S ribosomal protein S12 methylthiotransferase RimO n=1 Tax=Anaerolentibacter hominis TaxID=3079009 RepID=UPI0031B7F087